MAPSDLNPVAKLRLGKAARLVGVAVILIGLVGGALVALSPTQGADGATQQNLMIGVFCCFGPSLLASVPILIVGRMLRESARRDDIGSLYRGWD
jgi:drug/metabolite transporter (DMT)-like permease